MQFTQFFEKATGQQPYRFQRAFAETPALPDLLEAPTGSGKTATAVLGWLWRRRFGSETQRREAGRRLVFCLPMRTLVTQTLKSVKAWLAALGLESDVGVFTLMGGAVDEQWDEHPERDAILFGTQDQLLSRALLRGYGMSRFRWPVHFALLNNDCTWVLDEVQLMGVGASTAAQLQAFREGLGTAGTARTVWMTATLDEDRLKTVDVRRPLAKQPFDAAGDEALLRRTTAKKELAKATSSAVEPKALAAEIGAAHVAGSLTLVVVNRVQRAQDLYRALGKDRRVERVALIHSRFRPSDRGPLQDEALSGTFAGVVVATQAIEAGVDISARTLFTELAPWSSIVQRCGRLNRAGEHGPGEARAFWIDLETAKEEACKPYEAASLDVARTRLASLSDVGPVTLSKVPRDHEEPALPVVRKKDLLELFDTEPDLSGHDIDVSRYVRATDDRDVQVAWRDLKGAPPSPESPALQRDELCRVPFFDLKKLLGKDKEAWRFDSLRRAWVEVDADAVFPGMTVLLDVTVGGYDDQLGFTKDKANRPTPLPIIGDAEEDDDDDRMAMGADDYVTLSLHSSDAAEAMEALVDRLAVEIDGLADAKELVAAARFHDAGKAHAIFQQTLTKNLPPDDPRRGGGPWAKSDGKGGGRSSRKFFRHELASALVWLREGRSDVGAFVVAAHHGKVRLSLRARPGEKAPLNGGRFCHGVHDGDVVPGVDLGGGVNTTTQTLSLACMELGGGGEGPSWSDRMLLLLERLGPFRLAYLETLVRVADWRASAKRSTKLQNKEARRG
jgi:CRISPR-associated endonuclease/helicase Cas3